MSIFKSSLNCYLGMRSKGIGFDEHVARCKEDGVSYRNYRDNSLRCAGKILRVAFAMNIKRNAPGKVAGRASPPASRSRRTIR